MIEVPMNNVTISVSEYALIRDKAHCFDILYAAVIEDTSLDPFDNDVLRPNGSCSVLNLANILYETVKPLTQTLERHPVHLRLLALKEERRRLDEALDKLNKSGDTEEHNPHKVSTVFYGADSREGGAEQWQ